MLTVKLTVEEWRALHAIVEGCTWEEDPEKLLEAFVHDLTGFPGNGGGDERDYSRAWVCRRYGPPEIAREYRREFGRRIRREES